MSNNERYASDINPEPADAQDTHEESQQEQQNDEPRLGIGVVPDFAAVPEEEEPDEDLSAYVHNNTAPDAPVASPFRMM